MLADVPKMEHTLFTLSGEGRPGECCKEAANASPTVTKYRIVDEVNMEHGVWRRPNI